MKGLRIWISCIHILKCFWYLVWSFNSVLVKVSLLVPVWAEIRKLRRRGEKCVYPWLSQIGLYSNNVSLSHKYVLKVSHIEWKRLDEESTLIQPVSEHRTLYMTRSSVHWTGLPEVLEDGFDGLVCLTSLVVHQIAYSEHASLKFCQKIVGPRGSGAPDRLGSTTISTSNDLIITS